MKTYLVWIYTKSGNRKRYEISQEDLGGIYDNKAGLVSGKCISTGMKFVIPISNVDIMEHKETES